MNGNDLYNSLYAETGKRKEMVEKLLSILNEIDFIKLNEDRSYREKNEYYPFFHQDDVGIHKQYAYGFNVGIKNENLDLFKSIADDETTLDMVEKMGCHITYHMPFSCYQTSLAIYLTPDLLQKL